MRENLQITFGTKNKIKSVLDNLFLALIVVSALLSGFLFKQALHESIFVTILLLIYAFQYRLTKKWVEESFLQTAQLQVDDTTKATQKIIEISDKQKGEISGYIKLIENATKIAQDLQTALNNTKMNAQSVSSKAAQSLDFSQKEQVSVKVNIEKMNILRQKIQIIAGLILDLSEHTQQIGETIYLIEDIAEQTNMLALNAAVEAARAGEHGKGFSIVAGEIRKLADESKQATTKITSLIKNIQQATNSTVMATEEGSKEIELGVELADNINKNIDALINIIGDVKIFAEKIYTDSEEQTVFSSNVNSVIGNINDGLKNSLKVIEEKIDSVNSLDEISYSFKGKIGQ